MGEKKADRQLMSEFRFGIVGRLLANPPNKGGLITELRILAEKDWLHPISHIPVKFSAGSIERWYYLAKNARADSISVLARKVRTDKGKFHSISAKWREQIRKQYSQHPTWSWILHWENVALISDIEPFSVSYSTFKKYMRANGMYRHKKVRGDNRDGAIKARIRLEKVETRSYEVEFVGGLWHLDFHHARRQVLNEKGEWITPIALGIIDDHSRLICHLQWFCSETAEVLVHGFIQALEKRGLPRALMTDNGSAMSSSEFREGLIRLGILQEFTLPYSPQQNAKIETLWAKVESRLMAMLDSVKTLTIKELNHFSYAWAEREHNHSKHSEICTNPYERFLNSKSVMRESPEHQELVNKFRTEFARKQRRSDGTIMLDGKRYEIPSRFRNLRDVYVQFARWNPNNVHIVDPDSGKLLNQVFPLDKARNANQERATIINDSADVVENDFLPAKLLQKYMKEIAATGMPLPIIPFKED